MNELPFINLPDYFTFLLRSNMQTSGKVFMGLKGYIYDHKGLKAIIEKCFQDIDKDVRLERIINSLGWVGLRDRLAAIFLHYHRHGEYPAQVLLKDILPVLEFEQKLKGSGLEGFSRIFLLRYYFEFVAEDHALNRIDVLTNGAFKDFISLNCTRVQRADIFLLSLFLLHECLGDQIFSTLKQGHSFQDIFHGMDVNDQYFYIKNMLTYGATINESDLFCEGTI